MSNKRHVGILLFWMRIIIRRALFDKLLTVFKLLGLVLGICSALIIFNWLNAELTKNSAIKYRADIYRLARIWESPQNRSVNTMIEAPWSPALYNDLSMVVDYTLCRPVSQQSLLHNEKWYRCNMKYVDSTFIRFFGFDLINGNINDVLKAPYSVVLTKSLARAVFGEENPIGREIRINNLEGLIVKGIIADPPNNITMPFDCLVSFSTIEAEKSLYTGWGGGDSFIHYVKLSPSVDYNAVEPLLMPVLQKYYDYAAEAQRGIYITPLLQPLKDIYLKHSGNEIMHRIYILFLAAVLIVVISAFNYTFISLSSLIKRNVHSTMPLIFGQKRWQSVVYFVLESLVFTALAGGIALLLSPMMLSLVSDYLNINLNLEIDNVGFWFVFIGIIIMISIVGALFPILRNSRKQPIDLLQNMSFGSFTQKYLRQGLTVFQLAVSAGVLLFTILVVKQTSYMSNKALGYNEENLVYIELPENLSFSRAKALNKQISEITGVKSSSLSSDVPFYGFSGNGFEVNGDGNFNSFRHSFIDSSYLTTMGIELRSGHGLKRNIKEVLVNEALMRKVDIESHEDLTLSRVGIDFKVVGVVKDFHMQDLVEEIRPLVYCLYYYEGWYSYVTIRLDVHNQFNTINKVKDTYATLLNDNNVEVNFFTSQLQKRYQDENVFSSLLKLFTLLVFGVAFIGLLAFVYLSAQQRTKEIGIRKVNGANEKDIVFLFLKQSLVLMGIAFIIALILVWPIIASWLQIYPYKTSIETIDLLKAILPVAFITVCTVVLVSWKAAKQNPIKALRYE
ncbi:FtsX-like permease family protein [Carboxylicivirga sp. N1Y90]|uniref:ABC transporter permease n=1 Tax=Carboxylicivirga fragile TaxID=3417571 RepID=UPI003D32C580|nr:ABC transporter permease [Marinilabiliaceae bacterium N1Y90]